MNQEIAIVIPVYNNPNTIKKVLDDALLLDMKIIVIDDGSEVSVESLVHKNNNLLIVRHEKNRGKGEALLTAAKTAKELGFKHIIAIDGDGQHYPSEVKKL